MQAAGRSVEIATIEVASRLAGALARPLDLVAPGLGRLEPLSADETRALAAHPAFRGPVNRAVASVLGLPQLDIGPELVARARTRAPSRVAILLVTQPIASVRQAALHLGAACLHKSVLAATLKPERSRLRAILGEEPYATATHEAPILHPILAELDDRTFDLAAALRDSGPVEDARERIVALGLARLRGLVEAAEPGLAPMMALRAPSEPGRPVPPIGAAHGEHIVRLLRRRVPAWSPFIG